jgi:hypothetical protein
MPASRLALYDLVGPQFVLAFPEYTYRYLSVLGVDVLRTSINDNAIVLSMVEVFRGRGHVSN